MNCCLLALLGCLAAVATVLGAAGVPELKSAPTAGVDSLSLNLTGNAAASNTVSAEVVTRVADIQAALAQAAARAKASGSNAPVGMPAPDVIIRRGLLDRLVRIYEQQLSNLAELQSAKSRREDFARQSQAWSGFAEPRPFSILLTDRLREGIQTERLRMESDKQALSDLEGLIAENREVLARAEEKIRGLNEQLETAIEPARLSSLSWQRESEQIRSQVAMAAVTLLDLERQVRQENLAGSRSHLELLHRQIIIAEPDTQFTQSDLDKVLAGLEAHRLRFEHDLDEAEKRHRTAVAAWEAARQLAGSTPESSNSDTASGSQAAELLGARAARTDEAVTAVRVLRLRLEVVSIERTLWELRFAVYGSREVERLSQSEHKLETLSKRASLWKDYFRQKLETSARQMAFEEGRAASLDSALAQAPLARERLAALRERDQWLLDMFRATEQLERLLQRWNDDLQRDLGKLPFGQRIRNLFSDARTFVGNVWAFELFTAEDTITVDGQKISGRRSITVGKVLGAILILVIGYWITGVLSEAGRQFIQKYLSVEANQGQLIRRWMRATMVVCLVLFTLVSVKIPLTVFAFAGGALAIGIGFGTQTILKNVVSGLIILLERPFGVGDVLDVGGQKGTLTSIGLRASVLQLWDGTETLFPNSNLLENALTNWTYTNRIVRFNLTVGVAYGSDTRCVVQVLEGVLLRHGQVEKNPVAQVFFTDFGSSALAFEVRYWLDVVKTNPAQVSSDLRHMIVGAFAEHGIVIAFPQRDLHLNTARPLQVEVTTTRPELFPVSNGSAGLSTNLESHP